MKILVPHVGKWFRVGQEAEYLAVAHVDGIRDGQYLVRDARGHSWLLRVNPGEALDGVGWVGEPAD